MKGDLTVKEHTRRMGALVPKGRERMVKPEARGMCIKLGDGADSEMRRRHPPISVLPSSKEEV